MLTFPIILSALASSANLVLFVSAQDTGAGQLNSTNLCADTDCVPKLLAKTNCKDLNDANCICQADYHFQVGMMKCLLDDCPNIDDAMLGFGFYALACQDTNASNSTATTTSTASTATSTPAAAFSLPSCGASCITKSTFTNCTEPLAPSCVCQSIDVGDNKLIGGTFKCIVDKCDDTNAAASITQLEKDCGAFPPSLTAKDLPFPFNKLAEASPSQGSSSSNQSQGQNQNQTSGQGQGSKPDDKNSHAFSLSASGLSAGLALAFGLVMVVA